MRRKHQLLIFALVTGILALGMSTTAFCRDMSKTRELVLFEETGARVTAPLSAIEKMIKKDNVPSNWSLYVDEQSMLDATNGLMGPLQGDLVRAGVLRYNLQSIIRKQKAGATPALAISPDGMKVKLIYVIAFGDNIMCDLTTLEFNNNRVWPRYLQTEFQHYLNIPPIGD